MLRETNEKSLSLIHILLPVSELHDFPGHPFQVRDDEEMEKLAESLSLIHIFAERNATEREQAPGFCRWGPGAAQP